MVCPNLPVDMNDPEGQVGVMFAAAKVHGTVSVPIDGGDEAPISVSTSGDPAEWRVLGSV